jgi:hypothetical protein
MIISGLLAASHATYCTAFMLAINGLIILRWLYSTLCVYDQKVSILLQNSLPIQQFV